VQRGMTKPLVVLAALCVGAAKVAAEAQVSGNEVGFVNSGQTAKLDCAGGKAAILGSSNVLTITGNCSALALAGSDNKITIRFGPDAQISLVGSGNAIAWVSTDGKPPRVTYVGSDNTLTPPIR
jgi:Protein of unknown function (DUF3060)